MSLVNFLFIVLVGLTLSGCSILNHLDQISSIGEYSRDKDEQNKIVDQSQAAYEDLVSAIDSGKIKDYSNQSSILHNFGEPNARKTLDVDGKKNEQWLYRYAIPQKAQNKLYLYFDEQGKLIHYNQEKVQW